MKITNSIALVTGANRGIGRALVEELLNRGVGKVYAASRGPEGPAQERVEQLRLDVTDPASVAAAARVAADVNLLINNAGVLDWGDILETPLEALKRNLDVNLYGKLHMSRAFAPVIQQNGGGAITNILTLLSLASMPGASVYNASKAAAWSMSMSLRATLSERGVAVHNVFPGAVDTDMLGGVEMPKTGPAEVARAVVAGIEADHEDILPDPMSSSVYEQWRQNHKAVEKQFAAM